VINLKNFINRPSLSRGEATIMSNNASNAIIATPGLDDYVDRVMYHFRYNADFCRIYSEKIGFASTESKPIIKESVRKRNVFLVADLTQPDVDRAIMHTDRTINALESSHAESISLVAPFLPYMRQDHQDANVRSSLSAQALISQFERYNKLEQIITIDLHAPQIEGFGKPGLIDNLSGAVLLDQYLATKFPDPTTLTVVSPDVGGLKRARSAGEAYYKNMTIGSIDKRRDAPNEAIPLRYIGSPEDIEGKDIILFDDMVDTAISVINGGKILQQHNPKSITVFATAGVLSEKDGVPAIERFRKSGLQLVILDTILRPESFYEENKDCLTVLRTHDFIAKAIYESSRVGGSLQCLKAYDPKVRFEY
jgi:ribose-phosphate pyrophosphokinase